MVSPARIFFFTASSNSAMSYAGRSKIQPQSLLFATVLGCITSYYVVSKLLDDVDEARSDATMGMRIFVAASWSMWILFALYFGIREDRSLWYVYIALLCQLVVILYHTILKTMND